MATTFQPPKGTRDFYPAEMAVRRYIEETWRAVSIRHGFLEVDGPTFESLDLYKVKSGDEIVSQLFHFEGRADKEGHSEQYALRPEFTPTLARMVAAKANALPRPIKWFSIPRCYRAEQPQKGRLREFIQWNVDMLGGETPEARRQFDLETAALALDCLGAFGLTNNEIKLRWNDRSLVEDLFKLAGVPPERYGFAFYLLDRAAKLSAEQRAALYKENGIAAQPREFFEQLAAGRDPLSPEFWSEQGHEPGVSRSFATRILEVGAQVESALGLSGQRGFAQYDATIVRGLAYYTGFVWEISDARGQNRAIAGGGRYDKLIETFGGPSLPATGFGMGDVVLVNLLGELNKLPASMLPKPDVFLVSILDDSAPAQTLLAQLRASKLGAIGSYKATKNIGKLLQDASASGAKVALILAPAEFERGVVKLKNLATRAEEEVPLGEVVGKVHAAL